MKLSAGIWTLVLLAPSWAQSRLPEFEVASVKPDNSLEAPSFGVGVGHASEHNVTLTRIVIVAYRLLDFQVLGGPKWSESDRYDIEAKAADAKASQDQVQLMLQALLASRFKLVSHMETKESPVFNLVIAKGGPKIKLSTNQGPPVDGPAPPKAGPNHGAIRMGPGSLIGNAGSMETLIKLLSQRFGRPVIDQTGLTGRYDMNLRWTPDVGESPVDFGGNPVPPLDDRSAPSIFAAMEEQLGLKLEPAKAPVKFLVIDSAEKPSPN